MGLDAPETVEAPVVPELQEGTAANLEEETPADLDPSVVTEAWEELLGWLPPDLDALAKQTGALKRRREIRTGEVLLRMVLAYAVLDLSMRSVSAWMAQQALADISDVGVLKRLRQAPAFLSQVLAFLLKRVLAEPVQAPLAYRVLLGDATALREPGSPGLDWRLHVSYDVARAAIAAVELTDVHGGEHLQRLGARPGDLLVCDGIYARPKRLVALDQQGVRLLVRVGHQALRLTDEQGRRLDPLAWAQRPRQGPGRPDRVEERPVWLHTDMGTLQARLLVVRRSREETERERQRLRAQARRKGTQLTERTLAAAAYLFLLTTVPPLHARHTVLAELYRVRWQVELLFKRLKSLLALDALRAHAPEVVQSYLLGKLIAAVLVETIARQARAFSPWGAPLAPIPGPSQSVAVV